MSVADLLQHRISVHSFAQSGTDEYGNPEGTFTPPLDAPSFTTPAYMQRRSEAARLEDGEETRIEYWACYLLPVAVIKEQDRVKWDGREFLVETVGDVWGKFTRAYYIARLKEKRS